MKVLLTLILASGIYCRSLKNVNQQRQLLKVSDERQESNTLDVRDGFYENSIFDDTNYKSLNPNLIQKLYQYSLLIEERLTMRPDVKLSPLDKAIYLFIKTMKQRDKRQNKTKYLTLCHFKICNIGGKRNVRYVHMSKSVYDNKNT